LRVPLSVRSVPAVAFRAWLTPPPIGERTVARDRKLTADLDSFRVGDVAGFETGSGPLVLALHGWGGRPAQMTALAHSLADEGYRVVVPELPGRAGGEPTDIKQTAAAVRAVVEELGMPEVVVAHSFAAMVARLAFWVEAPRSMVLFAPALDVHDALDVFGDRLGLLPWARRGLGRRLESWDREMWPTVSGLRPDQFPDTAMIIFHDPDDQETPFSRSAELAALRPATTLRVCEGVGHSRILADSSVLGHLTASVRQRTTSR
jgi:pimeloyl-ACP methyl ester carboxylesterase